MKERYMISNFFSFIFLRKYRKDFEEKIVTLKERQLNEKDPVEDLRQEALKIIKANDIVFWFNSKSFTVNIVTFALFEKHGKMLRKVYRRKLSDILKSVESDKCFLTQEFSIKILEDLKSEYVSLSRKDNIFRRYPCREGKKKVRNKIEYIEELILQLS